jgi:hypothetical protein
LYRRKAVIHGSIVPFFSVGVPPTTPIVRPHFIHFIDLHNLSNSPDSTVSELILGVPIFSAHEKKKNLSLEWEKSFLLSSCCYSCWKECSEECCSCHSQKNGDVPSTTVFQRRKNSDVPPELRFAQIVHWSMTVTSDGLDHRITAQFFSE